MPNPYYIEPGGNYGQAFSGLASMIDQARQQKEAKSKEQAELDRVNAMKQGALDAYNSKDPEKIRQFMIQNPEMGQTMKQAMEMKFPGESGNQYKNSLFSAAIDFGKAPNVLESMRSQFMADGVIDENEQARLDEFKIKIESDPEQAKKDIEAEFAAIADDEQWKRYQDIKKESGDKKSDLEIGYRTFLSANGLEHNKKSYKQYQDQKVSMKREMEKKPIERPFITDLMAKGYVPSTRITGPMLDAYEAAAKRASEMGKPLSVQDLYDMEFKAKKNASTGSAAGSRLVLSRKQNIEAAQGLLDDMKKTAAKLNYSPVKFIGALEKWKKGQLNDPIFTEYMTQRADSLFILGNALKQNGLTDKSIEVEEEAFSPTLAPEAFNAWVNTQVRALNRAAEEMNRDFKYGIEPLPSFPSGQGGAPTKENPKPTLPGEEKPSKIKFLRFK